MNRFTKPFVCLSLLILPAVAVGQTTSGSGQPKTKTTAPNTTSPDAKSAPETPQVSKSAAPVPGFGARLTQSVTNDVSDPDDHVRCFLTVKQLMNLRPNPGVARLTDTDQSQVLTSVVQAVDAAKSTELNDPAKRAFMEMLAGELDGKLVGKTPGEALATIMNTLYQIQAQNSPLLKAAQDPNEIAQATVDRATQHGGEAYGSTVKKRLNDNQSNWFKVQDPNGTLGAIASLLKTAPDTSSSPTTRAAADKTAQDLIGAASITQVGKVVDSARDAINKLVAPQEIGCAYQILTYDESKLLFGRSVANNFIGVQVTVRNLDATKEFIIHNAMLCVDTDINGAMCQYREGVDKIGVEAYNKAGESLTARGIVGNSITAASALLSTLQPIVGAVNFSNAVAAFNGGVPKGWSTLSPDHQQDQLLLIANSGFSATYTTKTVVGKSGVATFYTWFPAKPFLEGWWVQDCAQTIVLADPTLDGAKPGEEQSPNRISPQVGVDLKRARTGCKEVTSDKFQTAWKTLPYQKWSAISDQLFRDLSLAVVAGIYTLEDKKNKASVTDVKCPKNSSGDLDLPKASSDSTFTCDVTGDNLDKVKNLRLENAANPVDPLRPQASVSVNGDNTTAAANFKISDLASAPANTYNVYAVGKDGTENATGLNVQLDQKTISLTGVSPSSINLEGLPTKITLSGYNLNNLNTICLKSVPGVNPMTVVAKATSKTEAILDGTALKLSSGDWEIYLNDCSDSNDSKQKLTVTGTAPQILSFLPLAAMPGRPVTITGSNFTGATVTFGGVVAQKTAIENGKITAVVPALAKSGPIQVTTPGGSAKSQEDFKVLSKTTPTANPKPPSVPQQ